MMLFLLLTTIIALQYTVSGIERQWCPPIMFQSNKQKQVNKYRTAVLTDIHGQLVRTGMDWGTFVDGTRLSRFIFHHVATLGFDKVYINVMYNASIHKTPPTIDELYPSDKSCVSDWAGVIIWTPYTYAGPQEGWAVEPSTGQKSLRKDLWKPVRGLNPVFNGIRARNESDWVFVADVDELLTAVNFHPTNHDWCYGKYPSLINQALDQMISAAAVRVLQSDKEMWEQKNHLLTNGSVCEWGMSTRKETLHCAPIAAFTFPVYLWTNPPKDAQRVDVMPLIRTKATTAYDYEIIRRFNESENDRTDNQYKEWKSIHRIAVAPEFQGTNTMHHNSGFNAMAPRKYHNVISFEIAHVKDCVPDCEKYLKRDNRLHGLMMSYNKCMALLAK